MKSKVLRCFFISSSDNNPLHTTFPLQSIVFLYSCIEPTEKGSHFKYNSMLGITYLLLEMQTPSLL